MWHVDPSMLQADQVHLRFLPPYLPHPQIGKNPYHNREVFEISQPNLHSRCTASPVIMGQLIK